MRRIKIIKDNNGIMSVNTNEYVRCPFGSIVMQDVHMKQGCTTECAAYSAGSNKKVFCAAGKFEIGILEE